MSVQIQRATKQQILSIVEGLSDPKFNDDHIAFFRKAIRNASNLWLGFIDGKLVCTWGLVPPSLLSNNAYLWLYTTGAIERHEFTFVRQSQIAVKEMLQRYPVIVGHALVGNDRGIRWLKWLGAEFQEGKGEAVVFVIRRKDG